MHPSDQRPGRRSRRSSIAARALVGRRSAISWRPIRTCSVSRASTGICHGADGISWVAGQDAVADELVHGRNADAEPVGGRVGADRLGSIGFGVEGGDAETFAQRRPPRTVVQVKPSGVLQRMRFMVTASSRSGHWPPSLRNDLDGAGAAVRRDSRPLVVARPEPRCGARRSSGSGARLHGLCRRDR